MRYGRILLAVAVFALSVPVWAATLTVDLNGGAGYTDIQSAIDVAADGDTVLVKPGEYVITEPINFNRLHDPANPESPPVKNILIVAQAGAVGTTIRMGTPSNSGRASVFVFEFGESQSSVVDGFTITGGSGTVYAGVRRGGGLFCVNQSSPHIRNCTIRENSSEGLCSQVDPNTGAVTWPPCGEGGGMFIHRGEAIVQDCYFELNYSNSHGGGVFAVASSSLFERCRFLRNVADNEGGGFFCHDLAPALVVRHCLFEGNSGWSAITCHSGSSPSIEYCWIMGNAKGGLRCHDSTPTLRNIVIACNSASGISYHGGASPTCVNCDFVQNEVLRYSSGTEAPSFVNCIFWGNTERGAEMLCEISEYSMYSLIEEDPHFTREVAVGKGKLVDFDRYVQKSIGAHRVLIPDFLPLKEDERPDYSLLPESWAIDAGYGIAAPSDDIYGTRRDCGTAPDAGAIEFCGLPFPPVIKRIKRADVNSDSRLDIGDAIYLLSYLFAHGREPVGCKSIADANTDGKVDIADAISILTFLFSNAG